MSNDRSMPWFKLYSEARTDKKLACLTLAERGCWINLLCFASERPARERGMFDASDHETLAIECAEGDVKILTRTLAKLQRTKHLICVEGRDGYMMFRTFAERQARKPSDEPEATRLRQQKSRASRPSRAAHDLSRPVTRDIVTNANVTRLEEEGEEEREKDINVPYSPSGNSSYKRDDDDAPQRAATPATGWIEGEARRIAQRVAGQLKLRNPDITALMAILQQHACAPPWLEAEAAKCAEWYGAKGRKATIRLFDNWLVDDEQRRRDKASQNGHQNGKSSSNGHHTTPQSTTSPEPATERTPSDFEQRYQANLAERAQNHSKMVS